MAKRQIVNTARQFRCRTRTCAPSSEAKALLSSKLGARGKSNSKGYSEIMELVGLMKESNVWGAGLKGYLFRGDISTSMKSAVTSFAVSNRWQITLGRRIIKYGIIVRGGKLNKRHLLIFGKYRGKGMGGKAYCSLTII